MPYLTHAVPYLTHAVPFLAHAIPYFCRNRLTCADLDMCCPRRTCEGRMQMSTCEGHANEHTALEHTALEHTQQGTPLRRGIIDMRQMIEREAEKRGRPFVEAC